jgi:hypothetical protein
MLTKLQLAAVLLVVSGASCVRGQQTQPQMPAAQLVREVVYNELHDHARHGYWRYWIERRAEGETWREEQVETAEGPIKRVILNNGRPLNAEAVHEERSRLEHLLTSPQEQARHRQDYAEDENRIGMIVALLPDAFLYEYAGEEGGCNRLRFRPNPDYSAHSIDARVFHAMGGELLVNARFKRLARLDGRLLENIDFAFGMLGRVNKGGTFRLDRTQVSSTDWKTERLEVHMSGRAMLFKAIAHETSERRGGFMPVPTGLNLAQGMMLLEQGEPKSAVATPSALVLERQQIF